MSNHTASYFPGPGPDVPGHGGVRVYVVETQRNGLHCGGAGDTWDVDGCEWYGGSFRGRRADEQIAAAWLKHVDFVRAGGTMRHGTGDNGCQCYRCRNRLAPAPEGSSGVRPGPPSSWSGELRPPMTSTDSVDRRHVMTAQVALPAPAPHQGEDRCRLCGGARVTGDRYVFDPSGSSDPQLVVDVFCPQCGGCGRGVDHSECRPVDHAGRDHDDDDFADEDLDDGEVCASCHGWRWFAVQGFATDRVWTLRVPCGCATDLLVPVNQ